MRRVEERAGACAAAAGQRARACRRACPTRARLPLAPPPQCSAWGRRPLSAAQLRYAAADAACLLALLGSLVGAVGQPEEWPMAEAEAAEAPADGPPARQASAAGDGQEAEAAAGEPAAAAAGGSSSGAGGGTVAVEAQQGKQPPPQQQQQLAQALLGGCSLQQLEAAAGAWGVRLEVSGSRAVKRGQRRGARARQQQRKASGLPEPAAASALPLHVPWLAGDKTLSGEPRFLCDVMVSWPAALCT